VSSQFLHDFHDIFSSLKAEINIVSSYNSHIISLKYDLNFFYFFSPNITIIITEYCEIET